MSTKFPLEIPAAFGIEVVCPESFSAVAALKGQGGELCRSAERDGYAADLCSYTRIGIAAACGAMTSPAKPDLLLCCDNICSNMIQWYQEMARLLGIPMFLLDIPYQTGEVRPETIAYLRGQVEDIIAGIADYTGLVWEEERFTEACRCANASADAWERIMKVGCAELPPLANFELSDYMPLLVTGRCLADMPKRLDLLADSLEHRPPVWKERPMRIFFEGTPCWPHLSFLKKALDDRKMFVAMDTVSPSLLFRYEDMDGMLRAYCGTINGTSLAQGLANRAELCRAYGCEGILVHYNRSCRPWCGTLPELERRLREKTGLPVVSFSGDQADPRVFSAGQFETRLDGLKEIMETAQR